VREREFDKTYLAVVHGKPAEESGTFTDLLLRSKEERKTYVVKKPAKDVQKAVLDYETLASAEGLSLVRIKLLTGRTHQIRCQFSSRGRCRWPATENTAPLNPTTACGRSPSP
jgi:23S rRNA pseudouridine1911/1915/1917 synthase